MRKIYNASCIYVCVCVRGVGVRFYCGNFSTPGGGGFGPPGQLSCSTIMAIWNRIVNYIYILAVVSDDALL